MSNNRVLAYESDDVIISIGYFTSRELNELFDKTPPKYVETYDCQPHIFQEYVLLSQRHPNLSPHIEVVSGSERTAYITSHRSNTTICLPKKHGTIEVQTVSLASIIQRVHQEYGDIDKLLMNCEGSEIDIIKGTPSPILALCKDMLISFHLWVPEFKISKEDYELCLNKLQLTHTAQLLHKGRCWWRFTRG